MNVRRTLSHLEMAGSRSPMRCNSQYSSFRAGLVRQLGSLRVRLRGLRQPGVFHTVPRLQQVVPPQDPSPAESGRVGECIVHHYHCEELT